MPVFIVELMNNRSGVENSELSSLRQPNLAKLRDKRTVGDKWSFSQFFSPCFYLDLLGFFCCGPVSSTSASALVYQLAVVYLPCRGNAGHDVTMYWSHSSNWRTHLLEEAPFLVFLLATASAKRRRRRRNNWSLVSLQHWWYSVFQTGSRKAWKNCLTPSRVGRESFNSVRLQSQRGKRDFVSELQPAEPFSWNLVFTPCC